MLLCERKEYCVKSIVILLKVRPPQSLPYSNPTLFFMVAPETVREKKKKRLTIQATFLFLFSSMFLSLNNETSRHCFLIQYANVAVNSCQEERKYGRKMKKLH